MTIERSTAGPAIEAWKQGIPQLDRVVLELAIGAEPSPLPSRPALIVIDVLLGFTGTRPLPILEAIAEYPTSCGEHAWSALPQIRACVDAFRRTGLPIVWLRGKTTDRDGKLATRRRQRGQLPGGLDPNAIHDEVHPLPGETVLEKERASAFFDTSLSDHLAQVHADGVVLVGSTTSGCVRASAVDAYSLGYETFLVSDGCFDRSQLSHRVSIFDLGSKYATVLTAAELMAQLSTAERGMGR